MTLDGTSGDAAIAPVVEVAGVGKVFGTGDSAVTALDSVDLTIQPREKTMTDEEIEALAGKIVAEVVKRTGGTLRG